MPSLMHTLNQMGIFSLVTLLIGVIPAFWAATYALRPTESKLALMRPLSLAAIFAGLAGFVVGTINALMWALTDPAGIRTGLLVVGLAESLVPLAVAFGSLTVAWLLVAVGLRRAA